MENTLINSSKDALGIVTSLSLDAIILIVLFVIFLGYGFRYGTHRLIALVLSLYISIPIFTAFPYLDKINFLTEFYVQTALFLVTLILLSVIVGRIIGDEYPDVGLNSFVINGLLSLFIVVLFMVISYHVLPIESVYDFASPIDSLFSSTHLFFLWLIAPLTVLLFTVRR
jgi:hypothetical protein